ncbi:hypothetical protein NDU88_003015 [Pleurodeles waltl]|uniref:Uncharacterized protein n=1 Tax=Pleurodeles waltl TaxID=8319 RepID=A0AAV7NJF3_PLEWA|nr:hypothetical protein NDU88_003015 [Pleurodeles waltl]
MRPHACGRRISLRPGPGSPDRALWAGSQLRAQIQLSEEFCRWGVGNGVRRPAGRGPRHLPRIDAPLRERARYYCRRYLPRRGGGEDPLLSANFHRSCSRQDRPGLRCGAPAPFEARPGGWGRRGSRAPPLVAGGPKGPIQRSDPPVPPVSQGCEIAGRRGPHPHLPPILFAGSRFVGRLFYAVGVLRSGRRGFSHDQQRFGCSLVPGSSRGPFLDAEDMSKCRTPGSNSVTTRGRRHSVNAVPTCHPPVTARAVETRRHGRCYGLRGQRQSKARCAPVRRALGGLVKHSQLAPFKLIVVCLPPFVLPEAV